MQVADTLLQ